jgi:homogentisate 1,2-dioxygenase
MSNPQKCPMGLYSEQISGTSFTQPRHKNLRTWMYKIKPTVGHSKHIEVDSNEFPFFVSDFESNNDLFTLTPDQLRWKQFPLPKSNERIDFIHGISTYCGVGSPLTKNGIAMYMYSCNTSMPENSAFYSADGDFLIVPQLGELFLTTETGRMTIKPKEIGVIPRGLRYRVDVEGDSRGYICEIFKSHFILPDLGPIGSNGLANPRDFQTPCAWYEDKDCEFTVTSKFGGKFFRNKYNHSIFNCVSWWGNYLPFKYDLDKFNTIGTISFDHPDPSIFLVLTAPTDEVGTSLCDFVIFPPRWLVGERTFRPPYYHRNTMNEFMGNICGTYDAKEVGFIPGTASLHSCMSGHGPETAVFEKASTKELKPEKIGEGSLAFMFETAYIMKIPKFALEESKLDNDYIEV